MQNRISSWSVVAFLAAGVIGLAAQTYPPAESQAPQRPSGTESQSARAPRANTVTITGCVERAPDVPTATTGAAAPATSKTKFMLTKASPSAGAGAEATAGATKAEAGLSYRLDDAAESKVSPHVGHKVEITGTLENQGRPAAGANGTTPAPAAPASELKVDSVKMISATCASE